jgi:hypothetical protein
MTRFAGRNADTTDRTVADGPNENRTGAKNSNADIVGRSSDRQSPVGATETIVHSAFTRGTSIARIQATARAVVGH